MKNTALEMARFYASLGYMVFPCHSVKKGGICTCRDGLKCPDSKIAKHPRTRHGRKDATIDIDQIKDWWTKWPDANVAIATGRSSGIFVLDVDSRNGGTYALERLEDAYRSVRPHDFESVSATQIAITGSGGRHYIFKYPKDFSLRGGSSLLGRGLDICSDGQHIIAPPSLHKSGTRYRWHGEGIEPTGAPDWLIYEILQSSRANETITRKSKSSQTMDSPSEKSICMGARNDTLFRYACGLVNTFESSEVRRRTDELNTSRCMRPLEKAEIDKILQSVERYRK